MAVPINKTHEDDPILAIIHCELHNLIQEKMEDFKDELSVKVQLVELEESEKPAGVSGDFVSYMGGIFFDEQMRMMQLQLGKPKEEVPNGSSLDAKSTQKICQRVRQVFLFFRNRIQYKLLRLNLFKKGIPLEEHPDMNIFQNLSVEKSHYLDVDSNPYGGQ